ncbi:MAG: trigger factor [Saprospiraceae bacterium]
MPTVARQDLDQTHCILTVSIFRDDIKPRLTSELKRFRQRATIKGFRQGQVPMDYIKKMYGTSIFADLINEMVSNELFTYLRENKMDVLGQPLPTEDQKRYSFKVDAPEEEYTVSYEVGYVPPFEIKGLDSSQTYERLTVSDLDALAETDLDYARNRMGKRSNPEDDIQENDILRVAAKEEGGDWATTVTILVKDLKDEALKTELLGKKKGDSVRFNVRSIDKVEDEKMLRKYILNLPDGDDRPVGDWFEGTIEEVSRVGKADLDQEFFDGYFGGNVTNADEAREELKKGIRQFYDVRSNALLMREFQRRLMELNQMPLPETFLKKWLAVTNEGRLNMEDIENQFAAFGDNLRWTFIKDKIKEDYGVEVTDQDVKDEYAKRVRNYFKADLPEHIITSSVARLMSNQKDVDNTRRDLETDKIFECIRSFVTITDRAVPSEEFHKILDAVTAKAEAEQQEDAGLVSALEG